MQPDRFLNLVWRYIRAGRTGTALTQAEAWLAKPLPGQRDHLEDRRSQWHPDNLLAAFETAAPEVERQQRQGHDDT